MIVEHDPLLYEDAWKMVEYIGHSLMQTFLPHLIIILPSTTRNSAMKNHPMILSAMIAYL